MGFRDLQTTEDNLPSKNDDKHPDPVTAQFPQFLHGLVRAGGFHCGIGLEVFTVVSDLASATWHSIHKQQWGPC